MENELKELFIEELADILHAEKQLTKALPKLAKAAESDELREAFESHLEETETHISRIEQVFEMLEKPAKAKKCPAMEGLVKEGTEVIEEHKDSPAIDAALIAAAQKAEHYEIASYGTLCAWAEMLELEDAVELLKETLDEEKATDEKLTELAESLANAKAEAGE